jgi:hypothetical protein
MLRHGSITSRSRIRSHAVACSTRFAHRLASTEADQPARMSLEGPADGHRRTTPDRG